MKSMTLILLLSFTAFACSEEPEESHNILVTSNIDDLSIQAEASEAISDFKVILQAEDGSIITESSNVLPNSTYYLVIEGNLPALHKIKMAEGFSVIKHILHKEGITSEFKTVYLIKTNKDLPPKLYVSINSVRTVGERVLKDRPKGYLFPN